MSAIPIRRREICTRADLMGAAWGTLVTSVVLIPYFGIVWAAVGLIGLKLSSLMVIATSYEKN